MAKLALCIKTVDAPKLVQAMYFAPSPQLIPIDMSFFETPTQLVDRALCETDTSFLQLLPYIMLEAPDGSLFTYTRGGGGEEARLHGNYSVGVGGHVDNNVVAADVNLDNCAFTSLFDLLIDEADREIEEEIGFSCDKKKLNLSHFIVDGTNPVGQVHLGLLCHYKLDDTEYAQVKNMILEENVIVSGRFSTLDTLCDKETFDRLENWSKVVVTHVGDIYAKAQLDSLSKESGDECDLDTFLHVPSDASTVFYSVAGIPAAGVLRWGPLTGPTGSDSTLNIDISTVPGFKDAEDDKWFVDLEQLRILLRAHNIELTHKPEAGASEVDTSGLSG